MSELIKATDVVKKFKLGSEVITAIDKVSISIDPGELVAIVGRSGSGKTTFLSCVGMLEAIDGGQLMIKGRDVSKLSETERTRLRRELMGFVFQRFFLIPTLTAYENVALPYLFAGKKAEHEKIMQLLETVGVAHRSKHKPGQMSGGEMQRVAIARALALDPPLLIADEPTGNLDTTNSQAVYELFQKLSSSGKTVIIATHSIKLSSACPRVIELQDGRVVKK